MTSQRTKRIVLMPISDPGGARRFADESIADMTARTRFARPSAMTVTSVSWFCEITSSRNPGRRSEGTSSPGVSGAGGAHVSMVTLLNDERRGGSKLRVRRFTKRKTG
jgi:hypothetical protein